MRAALGWGRRPACRAWWLIESDRQWVALAVAVVVGVLAGLLAVFFQKLAVALAGFLAGGLLAVRGMMALGHDPVWWVWLLAIFAGLLGAMLTRWLFEVGLIVLSSLLGAALILQSAGVEAGTARMGWALLGLTVVGMAVQLTTARRAAGLARGARAAPRQGGG
jgi:Domain of unknown function (DUF4203)